ncbi:MAG TPA: CocE/NonD family hydrolase, partial [Bacteroidetes bacterium]|nr:CocE/NonD family hydrolase [Bacteroidota bacterium]
MKQVFLALLIIFNSALLSGQQLTSQDYTKKEVYITMRDSVRLFTTIYTPKDTTIDYPALVSRTTYSCRPYGEEIIPGNIMYNPDLVAKGYIFIFQDVRGRWMSEGVFENTKPPYSYWGEGTDEVTDAWDTFDWIVDNVKHFNGNIGVYGNSYLGWSTLTAAVANHPTVKCILAMSPVTDFYFEDFTRYGLVAINYAPVINAFGVMKDYPTDKQWYNISDKFILDKKTNKTVDYYRYFLDLLTLKNIEKDMIDTANVFWQNLMEHPDQDDYRSRHNWLNYLATNINAHIMIAGGWNDEQNLYGILNSYRILSEYNPMSNVQLVMGPWAHSHPKSRDYMYYLGDVFYGYDLAKKYQQEIQVPYFEYYLKGKGKKLDFKLALFDTGTKKWLKYSDDVLKFGYPDKTFYLDYQGTLSSEMGNMDSSRMYISDPLHPVPFIEERDFHYMAPKYYMTDDQRFASKRKDVLTWISEPLERDFEVLGKPKAYIVFSTDHQDADIYVKLIDQYPDTRMPEKEDREGVDYKGYQQLVRMGYIRGRYRESFSEPIAFEPNKATQVDVPMLEVNHTFKKGHRIVIQIQS